MDLLKLVIDCKQENRELENILSTLEMKYSYLKSLEDK